MLEGLRPIFIPNDGALRGVTLLQEDAPNKFYGVETNRTFFTEPGAQLMDDAASFAIRCRAEYVTSQHLLVAGLRAHNVDFVSQGGNTIFDAFERFMDYAPDQRPWSLSDENISIDLEVVLLTAQLNANMNKSKREKIDQFDLIKATFGSLTPVSSLLLAHYEVAVEDIQRRMDLSPFSPFGPMEKRS